MKNLNIVSCSANQSTSIQNTTCNPDAISFIWSINDGSLLALKDYRGEQINTMINTIKKNKKKRETVENSAPAHIVNTAQKSLSEWLAGMFELDVLFFILK